MKLSAKITLLTFFYFIQGIPYGFQSRFLPVFLRKQGLTLTNLSLFKLLLIPWLCKALWAPFVDRYLNQRTWLLLSTIGLVLASFACIFVSPHTVSILCSILFFMNIFAATQDISVDRMALGLLEADELGVGNTAQVVGYKSGALFGGGILLWLAERTGWASIFTIMTLVYTLAVVFIARSSRVRHDPHRREDHETENGGDNELLGYWRTMRTVLNSPSTIWLTGFLLIYKLAEQGALSMLPLLMVDRGVTMTEIAVWTGMMGQAVSIFGSSLSGYLLSRRSVRPQKLLRVLFMVQFVPLGALYVITLSWSRENYSFVLSIISMHSLLLISGLVTTATFTMMMQCSQMAPSNVRATHYSVLATVEIFGKLIFASMTGYLADTYGYSSLYRFFIMQSFMVPLYLTTYPSKLTTNILKKSD